MAFVTFRNSKGLTIIELLLVVVLIAIISTFAATRFSVITGWKHEGELRNFSSTWQFLSNEAFARGESYRLIINLDENYYYALREAAVDRDTVKNVDYLKNLRTRREKERRAQRELEELDSLEEEFAEYDAEQSGPVDRQFYKIKFRDSYSDVRLTRPLEFPELAKKKPLSDGLSFRDVLMDGKEFSEGEVFFRFSPQGASKFAVIHFNLGEDVYTAVSDPATGSLSLVFGDKEFKWDPKKKDVA
jgi:prepilin-type N-terminal cleavage/methylation domain-containing protein